MNRYGIGTAIDRKCALDKERIRHALKNEIWFDEEDENGFVYEPCKKKAADKEILEIVDGLVSVIFQLNNCSLAQGILLEKRGYKSGTENLHEFFEALNETVGTHKNYPEYKFEEDDSDD